MFYNTITYMIVPLQTPSPTACEVNHSQLFFRAVLLLLLFYINLQVRKRNVQQNFIFPRVLKEQLSRFDKKRGNLLGGIK